MLNGRCGQAVVAFITLKYHSLYV